MATEVSDSPLAYGHKIHAADKAFKCPFKMYTDPTLALYRAVGLTRQTGDAGSDDQAGDYLTQSAWEATVSTVKRATQMPLRNPGHFLQLGGEFVFEGTLNVTYTHRMDTTRSHAPIRDVCAAAGVRLEWIHYEPGAEAPPVHRPSIATLDEEEEGEDGAEEYRHDWRDERQAQLERIRAMKESRRSGRHFAPEDGYAYNENPVEDEEGSITERFEGLGIAI